MYPYDRLMALTPIFLFMPDLLVFRGWGECRWGCQDGPLLRFYGLRFDYYDRGWCLAIIIITRGSYTTVVVLNSGEIVWKDIILLSILH